MPAFPLLAATPRNADLSLRTIVIDAGHGGKDAGTISSDKKTYEKTLTLDLSKRFAEKVREAYPEMKVVLTRSRDEFVPLNTRARIASDAEAQLFISIHINASARSKTVNGFSAYILGPSQKSKYDSYEVNMEVCKRENSVIYLEDDYSTKYKGYDDSPESQILLQLMQNAFREQSLSFAETVSAGMDGGPFARNWGVMQGNFAVLRQASMPAVLLEFGYMTNPDDLSKLRDAGKIDMILDNLFSAFSIYKEQYDKSVSLGTEKAEPRSEVPESRSAVTSPAKEQSKPDKGGIEGNSGGSVKYGTQVLASSKRMSAADKFFKGMEVEAVPSGSLFKYVLCPSDDIAKASQDYIKVKKLFPDSFFVKISDGAVTRQTPSK